EKYLALQDKNDLSQIRDNFIFTCHTPVAAGHDRFSISDVANVLEPQYVQAAEKFGKENPYSGEINLTFMALNNCSKVNAVAQKHGEVMRLQFPNFAPKIQAITNGVHTYTWASESFQKLFDKYKSTIGAWDKDPRCLENVRKLSGDQKFRKDLFEAHQVNKRNLLNLIKPWKFQDDVFTISWARRIANYKRPGLILQKIESLIELAREVGPIQLIMAGKAHPNDNIGGIRLDQIFDQIDKLNYYKEIIKIVVLENYDTYFGKLLTNSVDVWLNNPLPPFEASGTSGMKAIINGVLQMTTLDGWVVEAAEDDIGWIFGYQHHGSDIGNEADLRLDEDSEALYETLGNAMKLYYQTCKNGRVNSQTAWVDKMINCIASSAFFNTHRMVEEYNTKMWQIVRK
ncbi:MAG: alpha-glucan family phosphorylase, partial [Candidatus Omnitrophica bacterium]|nr:alpha-glucan family phosphorylase [Candidatus Omnitrophota bacterium]